MNAEKEGAIIQYREVLEFLSRTIIYFKPTLWHANFLKIV